MLLALSVPLVLLPGPPAAAFKPVQGSGLRQPVYAAQTALPARAGDLDTTFGGDGKVVTDFGQLDAVEDLSVQADGKIVAVGTTVSRTTSVDAQFALARYGRDGALDAGFGVAGKVTTDFGGRAGAAYAVAIQGDGKIVAAGLAASGGQTGADIALARYNVDGSLDESFGAGGKVLTDFDSTHEEAQGLAIQPDGKLVVVGSTRLSGPIGTNPPDFALARYHSNGSLDTSFDGDGRVSTGFTAGWADRGYGVAVARDGKVVAAGLAVPAAASGPGVIAVARYNADGTLDASFDEDGRVVSAPSIDNGAFGVLVLRDGKVVVAGSVFGPRANLALVRYTVDGLLDSTFGTGGIASADFGPRAAGGRDLVRQPDGKLVAAGTVYSQSGEPNEFAFAVARFGQSGKPDRSFHGGSTSTDLGAWDEAQAVALQPDGKIVVGGFSGRLPSGGTVTAQDFAVARYLAAALPCMVPNVRTRTLAVARSMITKAHCRVGKVRWKPSVQVQRGRVISQSQKAGTKLPNGSKLNLVVSSGRR
ncbi:MAG TPA: PASTA domain-containing protein [Gaiellaceae bacterium]|nr:PASTA domain-containing protein [Gaiellaceae bacterium]